MGTQAATRGLSLDVRDPSLSSMGAYTMKGGDSGHGNIPHDLMSPLRFLTPSVVSDTARYNPTGPSCMEIPSMDLPIPMQPVIHVKRS